MKWKKKGLICSYETIDISWYKKNTMVPLPYLIDDRRLRIFVTMCDKHNVGRIGYIDVDPSRPSEIIGYSKAPVIDIGADGCFCDNGVVTSSLLNVGTDLYLYYSGYQSGVKVPYHIFSGVALSKDNGHNFTNLSAQSPILDRIEDEVFMRSSPRVIQEGDSFRVWYQSDTGGGWIANGEKRLPLYDLKHLIVNSPFCWPHVPGKVSIPLANEDEHGITRGALWKEDDLYKIIYSIRTLSKGYRLGYAESRDGITFTRRDDQVGIDVSSSGWDSEMIAFPERFQYRDKTYLFYCGNHYGIAGMGYAELVES